MTDFSLALNDDQVQIKDWIHTFSKDVLRPNAEEWDEREEFPWPIVEEASKIGLYSFDFMTSGISDPSGLTLPISLEELFWGDAGIGLSIFGSGLAAAAHRRQRHAPSRWPSGSPSATARRTRSCSARCARPSPTLAPTWAATAPAPCTTRPRTSGC